MTWSWKLWQAESTAAMEYIWNKACNVDFEKIIVSAQVHKDGFCLLQLIRKDLRFSFDSPQGSIQSLISLLEIERSLHRFLSSCWHASVAITLSSVTSSLKTSQVLFCGVRTISLFTIFSSAQDHIVKFKSLKFKSLPFFNLQVFF